MRDSITAGITGAAGLLALALAGGGCATTGTATAGMAAGARVSIERVVFDEDPTASRLRVTGPQAVTVGWRIDVRSDAGRRSVEWLYEEVVVEALEATTTPPQPVRARAAELAERMGATVVAATVARR
jgi:hypothetical protein